MWVPPRSLQHELLGTRVLSHDEVQNNLEDMAMANTLLDVAGHLFSIFRMMLRNHPHDRTAYWLDLGSGGADIIPIVLRWAQQSNVYMEAIASDLDSQVLALAREHLGESVTAPDHPPWLVQHDARQIAFVDGSVDIVTCCHLFHHFSEPSARQLLLEMNRVARIGFVVIDLRRSWPAYWATLAVTTLLGPGHQISRIDGPLSVLRAYEPAEVKAIAIQAGLPQFELRTDLWQWTLHLDKALNYAPTGREGISITF